MSEFISVSISPDGKVVKTTTEIKDQKVTSKEEVIEDGGGSVDISKFVTIDNTTKLYHHHVNGDITQTIEELNLNIA